MKVLAVVALVAVFVFLVGFIVVLQNDAPAESANVQHYTYSVTATFPHDSNAFTEGLVYADGFLYESTGLTGASSLRKVNVTSGEVVQSISLSSQYFGEGIAIVGDCILQLTYKAELGFIYDKTTFQLLGNFSYPTQGWGLTYDGTNLIMSDGSSNLYLINPQTFERTGQIQVHDGNTAISNLNELEYVNGDVYANIFEQQKIVIIDLQTGQVKAWIDLSGLVVKEGATSWSVLNGIAYNDGNSRLFVTGKNWAHLYEITLTPK